MKKQRRQVDPCGVATLSDLGISTGSLYQIFQPNHTSYTTSVGYPVTIEHPERPALVKNNESEEKAFEFQNMGIAFRPGHITSVLWGRSFGKSYTQKEQAHENFL